MKESKYDVLIGADPELFVLDTKTSQFVSAHPFIPGTKDSPAEVPLGAVQVDGVAAEFNIAPASTRKEFVRNIKHVRRVLQLITKNHNPAYDLVAVPTVTFRPEYFKKLPFVVKLLGCTPDFDAYTGKQNPKPHTKLPIRTGSGHLHIGWTSSKDVDSEDYRSECFSLVKELDFAFMHPSTEWDIDTQRRKLYGAPGSCRPKPYGVEYRPLSNAWLQYDWSTEFVYDTAKAVTMRWLKGWSLIEEAERCKVKADDDYFKFSDFMWSNHLPAIDQYSPRLEEANFKRIKESRLAL